MIGSRSPLARCFLLVLLPCTALAAAPGAPAPGSAMTSRTAEVDGLKLHYLTAGHGPTVILLHGYAETSRMWKPLIPRLADKFTVIAPDLPGSATRRSRRTGWT